ncbi:hypothetical protein PRIPAC_86607 [Pristionchus pacificus]|uniref:G protein-coupled receptor n=1 Tax=Pristionchus pacificus TaxID=54126 RepID=A0A2A6CC12_PRIPA|nr:hypothetical protein PRIPAC_86607 [Pristionchus pacificus]|eukprot:PDM75714.1 G protein-coupled receptor [Pristionchus pacificus]
MMSLRGLLQHQHWRTLAVTILRSQLGTNFGSVVDHVAGLGVGLCSTALYSVHKMTNMENSFRTIIAWQMSADILKLLLTTGFCAIPDYWAPAEDVIISKIIAACCETLYFFACDLHTLFAIQRFILVVAHSALHKWRLLTPVAILFCFFTGMVKAFYLMLLDPNLYLRYDRRIMQWMFTDTAWTGFYKKSRTRARLTCTLTSSSSYNLSQSIPTSLVVVFYFWIYPLMEDENWMFATSTLMWTAATACDGFVIVIFHTRVKFVGWTAVVGSYGSTNTQPSASSPSAVANKQFWTASQEIPIRTSAINPAITGSARRS